MRLSNGGTLQGGDMHDRIQKQKGRLLPEQARFSPETRCGDPPCAVQL
jgi:hypothetical protein